MQGDGIGLRIELAASAVPAGKRKKQEHRTKIDQIVGPRLYIVNPLFYIKIKESIFYNLRNHTFLFVSRIP